MCLKRADIRTILYSPHYQQKKNILLFISSPNLYLKNQVIKSYSWIFDYNFTKKNLRIWSTLPHPLRLEWYMSDMLRFCVQDSNQKSHNEPHDLQKKILRKMTWIPIQSFVHRDYSRKKNPWLLSTTFSRYFTISNSKIIPFFSVALFSLYYYPHTTIPAPFLCFWKTPSRLLLPSFSEKLKDWLL